MQASYKSEPRGSWSPNPFMSNSARSRLEMLPLLRTPRGCQFTLSSSHTECTQYSLLRLMVARLVFPHVQQILPVRKKLCKRQAELMWPVRTEHIYPMLASLLWLPPHIQSLGTVRPIISDLRTVYPNRAQSSHTLSALLCPINPNTPLCR